jgi:DNA-binding transcriptional LysR family regulator
MDLFDFEVFITVAKCKSMNKAAKSLHISQSAVSSRIANIESELETTLFDRSKLGVSLSLQGRQFYSSANHILNKTIEFKELKSYNQIRIGVTQSLSHIILPVISNVIHNHSSLEWKIVTGRSKDLLFATESNEIDVAIINDPVINNSDLEQHHLFDAKLMLIGPSDYQKNWKSIQYFIQDSTFILPEKDMPLRNLVEDQIFKPLKIYPKRVIEVNTAELMKEFVSKGNGFAFLPISVLWQDIPVKSNLTFPDMKGRVFQIMELEPIQPSQRCICIYLPSENKTIINIIKVLERELNPYISHLQSQHEFSF